MYIPQILVCGEPEIAKNFTSVKQDWCKNLQIHQILDINGIIKNADRMPEGKKPLEMELNALKNAIKEKLTRLRVRAFGDRPDLGILELRPALNIFNINRRIAFKKRKRCAHY